jgi:hypothetical protein
LSFMPSHYSKMSSFLSFNPKMGSMKTENLVLLGVGGFLAYKMIKKDIDTLGGQLAGAFQMPSITLPNITLPNITLPNITLPNIELPQTIVVAGTPAASPQTPANIQPTALTPGAPDPFTGAPPNLLTGMPPGAQWANTWGPGYAYDWKTTAQPFAFVSRVPTVSSQPIMSRAPIMSYAQAPVFGAGTTQNAPASSPTLSAQPTAYQAQQAKYAAAAIGTPAYQGLYTPAYIATLPKTGTPGGGTAYQSGNGGYNTGIKYF